MKIALHRFVNLLSGSKRQTGEVFLYMAEAFLLLRLVWGGCRSAEGRGAAFFEKVGTCFLLGGGKNFSGGGPFGFRPARPASGHPRQAGYCCGARAKTGRRVHAGMPAVAFMMLKTKCF